MENPDGRGTAHEEMTPADQKIDRLADKLQELANRSAAEGGTKAKLAEPLADDAHFVRKLKPSLIKARAKGEAPTNRGPSQPNVTPSSPPLAKRSRPRRRRSGGGGPNPWLVAGLCFAAGIALAKWIDRRGNAHPSD
jgi:hypothetical protein